MKVAQLTYDMAPVDADVLYGNNANEKHLEKPQETIFLTR